LVDRRISQGAKGEPPVSLFSATPQTHLQLVELGPLPESLRIAAV
jgi:hypothetical protein